MLSRFGLGHLGLTTVPRRFQVVDAFGAADGFWFDFTSGATGEGIAEIESLPPGSATASQSGPTVQPVWTSGPPDYAKFDGIDDSMLATDIVPGAALTIAACVRPTSLGIDRHIAGMVDGSNNDACLSVAAEGVIAGRWGTQQVATIRGTTTGLLNTDFVGLIRANASTVELWLNGAREYQGAAATGNATALPIFIGAANADGSEGWPLPGRIYRIAIIERFVPDTMVVPLMRELGREIVAF